MKHLLSKRVIGAFCVLLLALFLLRPGAGWMRARVTNSISHGLGRSVQLGSVRLRFLPRPGFEIDDLLVRDDAAFGDEPLVRAPEVNASLNIWALLRGKIEISRLSLSEPSLNLTRNTEGKWNLEDLIDRTSHTSLAPTGTPRRSAGPSFPYIEATEARINLKLGTEKTHFALNNAEFALWQESENTWGMRLKARPIRTDANLTDTGVLNLSGVWRRAAQIHETPIQVSFQWKQAQIGQVSKLVYGTEKAWRGSALISGSIFGTPSRLKVVADGSVNDFRRTDVIGGGNLRLAAHCAGEYLPAAREVENLDCTGPVGDGYVQLKGGASGILLNGQAYGNSDLWLVASTAPAAAMVDVVQHFRPDLPGDIHVVGAISSTIHLFRSDPRQPLAIEGSGSVDALRIAKGDMDPIALGTLPFTVSNGVESARTEKSAPRGSRPRKAKPAPKPQVSSEELRAELGPVNLSPGKPGPLTAQVTVTRDGFAGSAHGDSSLNPLLQAARALKIPAPGFSGDGTASVDLRITGKWFSNERPLVTGTAHLRSVHAQVRGLNAPLGVLSADLIIDKDAVSVQNLAVEAASSTWHGSMRIPRPCPTPASCEVSFRLRTEKLTATGLNNFLNPALRPKAWYRFLALGTDQPSYLLQARATGKITIDDLSLGKGSCEHFASDLQLESGTLTLSDFKAECLGGTIDGRWEANFAAKPPRYSGNGSFQHVALETIAELMHDGWMEGSGSARYRFKTAGTSLDDLLASADLSAQFIIGGGRFAHIVFSQNSGPLRASDFSGTLLLQNGAFSFKGTKLTTADEVYTVSGTASLQGALNLKAVAENGGYAISGTLLKTRVSAIPNAEASLKP